MSAPSPTRRASRRRIPVWVVVPLLLLALLVAADRVGLLIAEREAATTLQRSQHLDHRPSVTIGGFPFLTQLAAGRFDDVRVRADDVPITTPHGQLRVSRLDVRLQDVRINRSLTQAHSAESSATALVTYADLSSVLHSTVSYAGNGRVRAAGSVQVAGVAISGSATGGVAVSGQSLRFSDVQVDVAGVALPAAATTYLAQLLADPIPLSGLPFGVRVAGVTAGREGIVITLTAPSLTFHR